MFDVEPIIADHKDVIHDVVFDYYGRRMATCSSDQTVKVRTRIIPTINSLGDPDFLLADLGRGWAGQVECHEQLESALRLHLARFLGAPGIWPGCGHMLI